MARPARTKNAFTIMELIIVTIIIGVIAAFAIPAYEKAMGRQKVRRAMITANLLAGAQKIYKTKNGRYWCTLNLSCVDLNNINTSLGLQIVPEAGMIYATYTVAGLESQWFQVLLTDPALFNLNLTPPSDIICTNTSSLDVCP